MMTLEEAKKLAEDKTYGRIPLTREIYSDIRTPMEVLRVLKQVSTHCWRDPNAGAATPSWGLIQCWS